MLGQVRDDAYDYSVVYSFFLYGRCITGTPGNSFSRSESSCLANCVERFLDTSLFMVNRIEQQRLQSGAGTL